MALYAIPLGNNLVSADGVFWYEGLVAFKADMVRVSGEHLAVGRCVRTVASRTVARLKRGMDKGALDLVLNIHMAGEAYLFPCAGSQSELVLRMRGADKKKCDYSYQQEYMS